MEATLTATVPPPARPLTSSHRFGSIDLLRGLVMIIMALDHTRDFFHAPAFLQDPLNLQTTTPELFFTRWITHFCAPVFVFLAGSSAWFQSLRKSKKELSIFLIKRGIWLILVEVFIISLVVSFDITFGTVMLQVIWAIGISMVLLGLMVWLPYAALLATGLMIVLGHNLLDIIGLPQGFFWDLLHRQGFYNLWEGFNLGILYPFLPWTGLMIMGYCFGRFFAHTPETKRTPRLVSLGALLLLGFVLLRAVNIYGDPRPWSTQSSSLYSFLSFLDTTKYPPSLAFMCMTIGPALLFLAFTHRTRSRLTEIISVFGRVPFFYYVLHFFVIRLVSTILFFARGHSLEEGLNPAPGFPFLFAIPGEGYSLGMVYLIWILIVASLYPLCKWFSGYKQRHKKWWLSYV